MITRQTFIDGVVGQIDCCELIPDNINGCAVLFHPLPTAGGSNTNKVVQVVAKSLAKLGYYSISPNSRGVGQSYGEWDNGYGELQDALMVYDHVVSLYQQLPVILAGFSFGGFIASQVANVRKHDKLFLIAPAVSRYEVLVPDTAKTFVVHGELDEIVPLDDLFAWARNFDIPIMWVPGATHFFHNKLNKLSDITNMVCS